MALDIKIEKRKLNFQDDKNEVYVAVLDRNNVIETDKMANEIAIDTGARPAQVKMIINTLTDRMMAWLEEGHGVRLGELGSFLPSVRSQSGETADEASIKRVRMVFYPSRTLSRRVAAISTNTVSVEGEETNTGTDDTGGNGGSGDAGTDFT